MNLKQATKILKKHNKWRRCNEVPNNMPMVNPKELGEAIDIAVNHLEQIIKILK